MPDTTITLYGAAGVTSVTPKFVFPSGTVKVEVEDVYIKDLTSNVEDDINLSEGEKLEYICSDYDAITKIDINADKVSGDISGWTLPASLADFSIYGTSVSGNISGWTLPTSLESFYIYDTSVSGDISGWTLPASLADFRIFGTSVSGNISGWTLPANLVYFYINSTSVSGDISGWTLPANLASLYIYDTSVSGDISGWTLPASLTNFRIHVTSVSGDISGWTLPASLVYFLVYDTALDYDASSGAFTGVTSSLSKIDFDNCSLTTQQVDDVLADLVTSAIENKTLDIGDNNSAPSTAGLASIETLIARGWTIKRSPVTHEMTGTIDAVSSVSGNLEDIDFISGTIIAESTVSGSLKVTRNIIGTITSVGTTAGTLKVIKNFTGTIASIGATAGSLKVIKNFTGTIAAESTVTGNLIEFTFLSGSITAECTMSGDLIVSYTDIPPFMEQDLIDPYSGGAWLWLCELVVSGHGTTRLARNTEDVRYDGEDFSKFNMQIGEQVFSGSGNIPRITLRIFQDINRTVEDIVNATEGALGADVKLIRVGEKYLTSPVAALEADYQNLATESVSEWVTFTLGVPNPLTQRYPLEVYSSNSCPWATPTLFKGPECQYAGGDGSCTGTYPDCRTKGNAVHWGGELGLDPSVVRI